MKKIQKLLRTVVSLAVCCCLALSVTAGAATFSIDFDLESEGG